MVLFTLQFHSVVDVITNSSSELFVGLENSKELMVSLVKDIYPGYLDDYEEVRGIEDLTDDELEMYISYHYNGWSNSQQCMMHNVTFDEMYETKVYDYGSYTYIRSDFISDNRERINNSIDPERKMFFMFSRDENPDWEMQERLMSIMQRYHLG